MLFRPARADDLDGTLPLLVADPASSLTGELYRERLATGAYLWARTWIAEPHPGAAPLAVAVWWAGPGEEVPAALDAVCVAPEVGTGAERTALAAGLLAAAQRGYAGQGLTTPPEYHLFLPPDWRERPEVRAAFDWRVEAAGRAGLVDLLERLRYVWEPGSGVPEPSSRLDFRAEPDDEVFVELFQRVLEGSLDATSRRAAASVGAAAQARADMEFYRDVMPGDRAWWRTAHLPGGETAGFALPSRNHSVHVVGYLGVLPGHRGRGYADELLGEITRVLAVEAGARLVRADTDLANTPMAAAFSRAGYRPEARRIVLSAP